MKEIKFRQRLDGKFHYWGFIDGSFTGPARSSSGESPKNTIHDQFTGLQDKNGVDIYEGDIIHEYNGFIRFIDGAFFVNHIYGVAKIDTLLSEWVSQRNRAKVGVKVIGNIHDNPNAI